VPDNVDVLDAANATVPIATDDVSGVQFQKVKLDLGGDGVSVPVEGSLPVTVGNFPATQPVSIAAAVAVTGPATDAQLRATPLPVSLASAPLPTNAATVAGQDATNALLTTIDADTSALAGVVRAEDTTHMSGDTGIMTLAVRADNESTLAIPDGDYAPLQVNAVGRLKVSTQPGLYDIVTGPITANAQTVFCRVDRASNVMMHMVATSLVGHNCTFEGSIDSTTGTDGAWFVIQAVRSNANTIETTTGVLAATPAYSWELSVNGLAFMRVRATAHTSGTALWKIQRGSYATEPIPAVQVSATQPVSVAAGVSAIGDVGIQVRANATGAASTHHIVSAATTNVAQIKATAGRVLGYCLSNTTASWQYVKFHNLASATAGAAVQMTVGIPPNGKAECGIPAGIAFTTAISRSIVTGAADADATATTVAAVVGDVFFA
jgi:hypothetical protein